MPDYSYHVHSFVGRLKQGEDAHLVSRQLQSVIDHYGTHGWDFCGIEKVDIEIRPGCLGSLLGATVSFRTLDQAIFRKPTASAVSPVSDGTEDSLS